MGIMSSQATAAGAVRNTTTTMGRRKAIDIFADGSVFINLNAINPLPFKDPESGMMLSVRVNGTATAKLSNGSMPDDSQAEDIKNFLRSCYIIELSELSSEGIKPEDISDHMIDLNRFTSDKFRKSEFDLTHVAINGVSTSHESSERLYALHNEVYRPKFFAEES